jgi:uracil-DNA glycosylase
MDFAWNTHLANIQNSPQVGQMMSLFDDYKWFSNPTEYQRLRDLTWRELGESRPCYPHPSLTYRAFYETPLEQTKVVIIGLDPYPRPQHPIGLSFGIPVEEAAKGLPSSLRNIAAELKSDVGADLTDPTLVKWAQQGVLMMNAKLSVGDRPQSHAHFEWEKFTGPLLTFLTERSKHPIVFLLWGSKTQRFGKKYISTKVHKHTIIRSTHPCRYSASKGFLGSKVFSKCNDELLKLGLNPINW